MADQGTVREFESAVVVPVSSSVAGVELEVDNGVLVVPDVSPSWYTPKRFLVLFCTICLINYLDRGTIASNGVNGSPRICEHGKCSPGSGIQGDFNLTNFEDGVISSAFMVGLLIASPIFATLAKSVNPFRLIGVGLSVWAFATAGCGFSFDFWSITLCRMLVGVGEASFISLAAPFIDDNAPPEKKTKWLSIFFSCIPSGIALGYVYGGLAVSYFTWHYAFWGEAVLMLPFAILGFVMKPLQLKGIAPAKLAPPLTSIEVAVLEVQDVSNGDDGVISNTKGSDRPFKSKCAISIFGEDMKALLRNKVYVVTVLGYVAYNFVMGAYSYWGPKAGYSIYHMENADITFGGITLICGAVGTFAGGVLLDKLQMDQSTIRNAFKLLSAAAGLGAAFCFGAFCFGNLYGFIALFAIGETLIFATQGPVNYVCLHCVEPSLRPLSMAISTVAIHIFGDVPSAPLFGILQDHVKNWRESALILTSVLFLASAIWAIGIFFKAVDRSPDASKKEKLAKSTQVTVGG